MPRSIWPAAISDMPSRKWRLASARASASAAAELRSRAQMHPRATRRAPLVVCMVRLTRQSVRVVLITDRPLRNDVVLVGLGVLLHRHAQRDVFPFGLLL